jgi:hypothetical protein
MGKLEGVLSQITTFGNICCFSFNCTAQCLSSAQHMWLPVAPLCKPFVNPLTAQCSNRQSGSWDSHALKRIPAEVGWIWMKLGNVLCNKYSFFREDTSKKFQFQLDIKNVTTIVSQKKKLSGRTRCQPNRRFHSVPCHAHLTTTLPFK